MLFFQRLQKLPATTPSTGTVSVIPTWTGTTVILAKLSARCSKQFHQQLLITYILDFYSFIYYVLLVIFLMNWQYINICKYGLKGTYTHSWDIEEGRVGGLLHIMMR
jgi:hypothetical protein